MGRLYSGLVIGIIAGFIIAMTTVLIIVSDRPQVAAQTANITQYVDQIEKLKHDLWHYDEQAKVLRAENERLNKLLIDSGLYVLENEISVGSGNISVVLRSYRYQIPEPEIITVNVTREVPVEKIVYESRTDWRYYQTLAEFTAWLEGKLVLLADPADCDDYAERLEVEAYKDGYMLSVQLVENGKLNGKVVSDDPRLHMGNLVMIGNMIYYVEPQKGIFRIVFVGNRD